MAYEILETCMLVPNVSKANCSGWVQAWGSIIGLAVAIGVPMHIRAAELKAKHAAELAAANVVGSGLLLMLGPILGCIAAVLRDIADYKSGTLPLLDARRLQAMMAGLPYPNEWQMLQISPFEPTTATALARGTHLFLQGRNAIHILTQQGAKDPGEVSELISDLASVFRKSAEQFKTAMADLEAFFELREGPENQAASDAALQ